MLYLVDVNYIGKSSFLPYLIFPLFIYSLISSLPKEKIISCIAEKYGESIILTKIRQFEDKAVSNSSSVFC